MLKIIGTAAVTVNFSVVARSISEAGKWTSQGGIIE
jgi:hypothetical protein